MGSSTTSQASPDGQKIEAQNAIGDSQGFSRNTDGSKAHMIGLH
jgi:hypothetical protein